MNNSFFPPEISTLIPLNVGWNVCYGNLCRSEIQDDLQQCFFYGDPKLKVWLNPFSAKATFLSFTGRTPKRHFCCF
jgi:hypothetical protein